MLVFDVFVLWVDGLVEFGVDLRLYITGCWIGLLIGGFVFVVDWFDFRFIVVWMCLFPCTGFGYC